MKVIFLDVDGVLNTNEYIIKQCNENPKGKYFAYEAQFKFDPIVMNNLRDIVIDNNAMIVISSTWRVSQKEFEKWKQGINPTLRDRTIDRHWIELIRNLNEYGIYNNRIIGVTPILYNEPFLTPRGKEIKEWLKNNMTMNINSFVILDDDTDMEDLTITHLSKCFATNGITKEVKDKTMRILLSDNMIKF